MGTEGVVTRYHLCFGLPLAGKSLCMCGAAAHMRAVGRTRFALCGEKSPLGQTAREGLRAAISRAVSTIRHSLRGISNATCFRHCVNTKHYNVPFGKLQGIFAESLKTAAVSCRMRCRRQINLSPADILTMRPHTKNSACLAVSECMRKRCEIVVAVFDFSRALLYNDV